MSIFNEYGVPTDKELLDLSNEIYRITSEYCEKQEILDIRGIDSFLCSSVSNGAFTELLKKSIKKRKEKREKI